METVPFAFSPTQILPNISGKGICVHESVVKFKEKISFVIQSKQTY